MPHPIVSPKKLIEVALPLDAINAACSREKSIRHGHPSTLHLWWARRPLAAARAVIFSQLVNDPEDLWRCQNPGKEANKQVKGHWAKARARLFTIIEDLVKWENTTNETVLEKAREAIRQSWRETCELNKDHPRAADLFDPNKMPGLHDPFAGGGTIPLEAQRLGLEAYASDLNPVAVLINKAMIEIPPKFAGKPPVNPGARRELRGVRRESDALSRDDSVAKGDAGGAGGLSTCAETAARRDVRDAIADYTGGGIDSGERRGGMDARNKQGQGSLFGDRTGVSGGSRDPADALRGTGLVPAKRHKKPARSSRRGQPDADNDAAEEERGKRSEEGEERVKRSEEGEERVKRSEEGEERVKRSEEGEERVKRSEEGEERDLTPHSSPLTPLPSLLTPHSSSLTSHSHSSLLFPHSYSGAAGLAEDVRYYGKWMRDEAFKRIGHLYPPIDITPEMVRERPDLKPYEGQKLTVIAWLWARTVKSPNPAFSSVEVPLASTFILSSKRGKEAYVEPVIGNGGYHFTVKVGKSTGEARAGTTAGKRAAFRCLMSGVPMGYDYIRSEGKAGRMGQKLMAIVAEGTRGRVYVAPTAEHDGLARSAKPESKPDLKLPDNPRDFKTPNYGLTTFGDLFTPRQLVALTTFSDLVVEARSKIRADALAAGMRDDDRGVDACGAGAKAYAEAVSVYLAFAVSKITNIGSALASWMSDRGAFRETFSRQALPMVWDFAEANSFADAGGSFETALEKGKMALESCPLSGHGSASQQNASQQELSKNRFVSTDPPYYDNIGYADLSDFFYVWLRRSLRDVFFDLLATVAVPKAEELIASPYRHGGTENAEIFFLDGMTEAMHNLAKLAHPSAPITIYYAFKQSETESGSTHSAGWETFLEAVNRAGLALTGTWPMRTEGAGRMIARDTNSLASSIVLVCRPRLERADSISRREFIRELNAALPLALDCMTRETEGLHSPVAPVDLSQAIIGPGMAVFSKYSAVLEADGTPMTVRTALQLINRFLADDDFDADTQFCLRWFEQHGWENGAFGEADVLARAKGTSVEGVRQSGVLRSAGGQARLLKWAEYPADWDPRADERLPVWEVLHQLIRVFNSTGDSGAGSVFAAVAHKAESARQLAYRLYTLSERAGRAEDARAYNELITSWTGIETAAAKEPAAAQRGLFE